MIAILIGIVVGVGSCEVIGRQLSGYSIVMETVDWFKRLG